MARIEELADAIAVAALAIVARLWLSHRSTEASAVIERSRMGALIAGGAIPSWLVEPAPSTGRFARTMLACLAEAPDDEVRAWTHSALQEAIAVGDRAIDHWTGEIAQAILIGALLAARMRTIAPAKFYEEVPEALADAMRAGAAAESPFGERFDAYQPKMESEGALGSEPPSWADDDLFYAPDGTPDHTPEPEEEAAPSPLDRAEPEGEAEVPPGDAGEWPEEEAPAPTTQPRRPSFRRTRRPRFRTRESPDLAPPPERTRVPEQEREVSTGFSSQEQRWDTLNERKPLAPGESYYFWLKVGKPEKHSIEVERKPIPFELLPREAVLTVVLFSFPDGIPVAPEAQVGELKLQKDGSVLTIRQPGRRRGSDLDAGREGAWLFFPVRMPDRPGVFQLRCNIYYEQVLVQSRLVTAHVARRPRLRRPK